MWVAKAIAGGELCVYRLHITKIKNFMSDKKYLLVMVGLASVGLALMSSLVPIAQAVTCSGIFEPATDSFPRQVLFEINGDPCTGAQGIGPGTHKTLIGQSIKNSDITTGTIYGVELSLGQEGTTTDSVVVSLRSEMLGPDLTSATLSTAFLPRHPLYNTVQLKFDKPISNKDIGFLSLRRTGNVNPANYAILRHADPGSYSGGEYFECAGSSCATTAGYDVIFKLLGEIQTTPTPTPTPPPSPVPPINPPPLPPTSTPATPERIIPKPTPADIDTQPPAECIDLKNNLRYRSRDANTNGEVSVLQDFLALKGYFDHEPTGYFGILTLRAVKNFQKDNGISPTGFVGPITKAAIKSLSCS